MAPGMQVVLSSEIQTVKHPSSSIGKWLALNFHQKPISFFRLANFLIWGLASNFIRKTDFAPYLAKSCIRPRYISGAFEIPVQLRRLAGHIQSKISDDIAQDPGMIYHGLFQVWNSSHTA
jgi:hypothetical protein